MGLEARREALVNREACMVIVQGIEAILWIDPSIEYLESLNLPSPLLWNASLSGKRLEGIDREARSHDEKFQGRVEMDD